MHTLTQSQGDSLYKVNSQKWKQEAKKWYKEKIPKHKQYSSF